MGENISSAVRAFAQADFTLLADGFAHAGFAVRLPAQGILQVRSSNRLERRTRLLLSVGVHGDETAPIEMVAQLLSTLATEPHTLAVDLMVVVGNPDAIAQGMRFVDSDLNRLFRASQGAAGTTVEALRAGAIMQATADFFAGADTEKWHLDLHTAIRASHFTAFAVVPAAIDDARTVGMLGLLVRAGIDAAILNTAPSNTFSAYTAMTFGAASATLELGQVKRLGSNDLSRFIDTQHAIDCFMREGKPPASTDAPQLFRVVQEVIKHSDAFRLHIDRYAKNFTPLPPETVIADDGATTYRVGSQEEFVVFPNPDVRKGLRAGLMVVRVEN